uniref:Uncharacterized protein n=1 Tax=Gopherus evgoodei TaxID=1825980 RepID=A0A8C4Y3Y6_9SAUR
VSDHNSDSVSRATPCGPPNAPVTWGQIKSLSRQAEHLLEQQDKEKSPENLLLALITYPITGSLCVKTSSSHSQMMTISILWAIYHP